MHRNLRHVKSPVKPRKPRGEFRAFWARFAEKVRESGAKPPFDRWLVIWAEEYVAAHPERKLAEQSPADVDAYLAELGRKPGVKGWQCRRPSSRQDAGTQSQGGKAGRRRYGC